MEAVKDYRLWERFLAQFPQVHLLQSSAWGKFKENFGWDVYHLMTPQWGAQILVKSILPGFRFAYIPKGIVGSEHATMDWITSQGSEEFRRSVVDRLRAFCRENQIAFVKVEPDILLHGAVKLETCPMGFVLSHHAIQPLRTILIAIDGDDAQILARMKQKTRYNIRLAQRKGVQVIQSSDLDLFYQMMRLTGKRDGFGVHTKAYYEKVYHQFREIGQCVLLLAIYQGSPIATVMVFSQGGRAFYFYGASTDQHREAMAPYLLQWMAIQWARAQGCTVYDLWGVPDYDESELEEQFIHRRNGLWGVYRFKRGFGGQVVRYAGPYDLIVSPLLYAFYKIYTKRTRFRL